MQTQQAKGWICLDIDGTITEDILTIPKKVQDYLTDLYFKGWKIVFVTGRIFSLAQIPLKDFKIPYYLIPQNGASWFEMPKKKMGMKQYLSLKDFNPVFNELKNTSLDVILFSGEDQGEKCFYRTEHLKSSLVEYIQTHLSQLAGNWVSISHFENTGVSEFAYGKIYGTRKELEPIHEKIKHYPQIKTHLIEDSVRKQQMILQIMHHQVDKGRAVLNLIDNDALALPIIAAGNDCNDETLLDIATVKIAMEGSPKSLLDRADLVAPSVSKQGIIQALDWAINRVSAK